MEGEIGSAGVAIILGSFIAICLFLYFLIKSLIRCKCGCVKVLVFEEISAKANGDPEDGIPMRVE